MDPSQYSRERKVYTWWTKFLGQGGFIMASWAPAPQWWWGPCSEGVQAREQLGSCGSPSGHAIALSFETACCRSNKPLVQQGPRLRVCKELGTTGLMSQGFGNCLMPMVGVSWSRYIHKGKI
jgi:hypothetical protein